MRICWFLVNVRAYVAVTVIVYNCRLQTADIYIYCRYIYVIESAAYGVLFTSCLCQKPERARNERVRVFDTKKALSMS